MLKSILAVVLALQQHPAGTPMVVERARGGNVSIGARAETVYREYRDRAKLVDLQLEGQLSPAFELKMTGAQLSPSLIVEIGPAGTELVVTRINVIDPALRTAEGIGVGSSYGELRSKYTVDWVGSGEGRVFARVEALGISFQLDTSGSKPLWPIREPSRVPDGIRIVSMLLTR